MREENNIEFKREYTADIKKEVIAFANSSGGVIYIGRDDEGNAYPLPDMDGTLTQITNSVRDGILPDVTMFVSYETARSLAQGLTFLETAEEFKRCGVEFGESQMRTLGIIGADGLYTNLGLLLSDQCAHTVKLAVFSGTKKGEFKTRKEIEGSVLRQMRSAFDFLSLSNNLAAAVSGLDRVERHDYPEIAVREAMLNAIVHRDYGFSGSIIVNIYDDRAEFVSLGGLMPGLRAEDLFVGVSQPRNEKLANVFYRLKHIEAYGIGLRLIMQYYEDFEVHPEINATHGAFSLTLPNMNYARPFRAVRQPKPQHKAVLDYLKINPFVTNDIVQKLISVKQTRAYTVIREMVNRGLIVKRGAGREDNEYILAENQK